MKVSFLPIKYRLLVKTCEHIYHDKNDKTRHQKELKIVHFLAFWFAFISFVKKPNRTSALRFNRKVYQIHVAYVHIVKFCVCLGVKRVNQQ